MPGAAKSHAGSSVYFGVVRLFSAPSRMVSQFPAIETHGGARLFPPELRVQMNGESEVKLDNAWKLCSRAAPSAVGVRSIQSMRKRQSAGLSGRWISSPVR